jgi:sugar lactone lactonase YvrE
MEAFKIKNGISATRYLGSNGTETAGSVDSLSEGTYTNKTFSVVSQASSLSRDIHFKSDGTTMYLMHGFGNTVYQYSLSTAWDISTMSYASKSFSTASQTTSSLCCVLSLDGTKMYVEGAGTVYQYTLSTAYDISTASYASKSFSVNAQDTGTSGIAFKSDGTKLYSVGTTNDKVHQYSLSTAWDISTASYDSVEFSVSSQDGSPVGLDFISDGTKMYIIGTANDSVYKYSLSSSWDISTASYTNESLNVSSQDTNVQGVFIGGSSSTDLYVLGLDNNSIYQYSTVAYTQTLDLSTGTTFSFTPSGATTVSFTNPPATGTAIGFSVEINGDGSAITWPSSVKWPAATAPTATATKELYTFVTTDGGTTYYGKKAAEGLA